MFAVISWNTKNGVTLNREKLEVQSSAKYVVMNGGKQEVGAAVSMLFRKDIWGGIIQSIHDSKKDAEQAVNEEINGINDNAEEVNTCHSKGKPLGKRQRKRKNYGRDYELDQSEKGTDEDERNEEGSCSPVQKKLKSKSPDQQKGKRKKASPAEKNELQRVTTEHDEMVITEILSCSSTSLPPDTFTDEKQQESEPVADCVSFTETAGKKTVPHPHFGGKQPKPHKPPKCISVTCKEEKENLAEELQNTRKELNKALDELRILKSLQENSGSSNESYEFGKLPRTVGMAKNWEEIGNGVWCCPIKVKAAVRDCSSRTALACALLAIFYPKERLQGHRLHELDQDIIEAITDFSMVAKITKEAKPRKKSNTDKSDQSTPPPSATRSSIKQALRLKCNCLIHYEGTKKKGAAGKNQAST